MSSLVLSSLVLSSSLPSSLLSLSLPSFSISLSLSQCNVVCDVCDVLCVGVHVVSVVCGVVWHAENPVCRFKTPPSVHSKRPVYASNTRTCLTTCARVASMNGDVLNVHTKAF